MLRTLISALSSLVQSGFCRHRQLILKVVDVRQKHWLCLDCMRAWPYTVTEGSSELAQGMDTLQKLERQQRQPRESTKREVSVMRFKKQRESVR